jgi:hypothetical protein
MTKKKSRREFIDGAADNLERALSRMFGGGMFFPDGPAPSDGSAEDVYSAWSRWMFSRQVKE